LLSIVLSYFRQAEALAWQLEFLREFPNDKFQLVLVDDASGDEVAHELLSASPIKSKLITILDEVPWNIPGSRNWGMVFADGAVCLRTDIDHRPTERTMAWLLGLNLAKAEVLSFGRVSASGERLSPHTDSFALRKEDYWEIGGYDENLSGAYGQNAKDFLARASGRLQIQAAPYDLVLRSDFISEGGSRSLSRNRRLLRRLNRKGRGRRILRLATNISVQEFNG